MRWFLTMNKWWLFLSRWYRFVMNWVDKQFWALDGRIVKRQLTSESQHSATAKHLIPYHLWLISPLPASITHKLYLVFRHESATQIVQACSMQLCRVPHICDLKVEVINLMLPISFSKVKKRWLVGFWS